MAASLLSFAHTVFGPGIWPGEWIWATIAAGFFLAVFPMIASLLVALIRKGTGNAYNTTTVTIFAIIGLAFALVIPWVLTIGMSQVYSSIFGGGDSFGLSGAEVTSMHQADNPLIGDQAAFHGGGPTVYDVLTRPSR